MSKFVRNPIRAIREPFGTAGLIVAMIALVAALGGTALAAAKLNSTQKKEVEKIAKKVAGKPGVAGPAGSAGPAGPAGSAGAKGDKGDAGSPGSPGVPGTPGAPGTSVSSEEFGIAGKEGKCVGTGGSKFTAGTTKTFACNGKNGAIQPEETLPSGASETGAWAAQTATQFEVDAPISFTIPLAAPLDGAECGPETGPPPATCQVHFINKEGKEVPSFGNELASHPSCPGSAEAPEALPGNLCVYAADEDGALGFNIRIELAGAGGTEHSGASTTGAIISLLNLEEEAAFGSGTWAVTAE